MPRAKTHLEKFYEAKPAPPKDMKAALHSSAKPDITHCGRTLMIYDARASAYGTVKYVRSNYLRPTGGAEHDVPTKADFERLRAYLGSVLRHTMSTLSSMEAHQAIDPDLLDVEGMKKAAFAVDTDPGNDRVGPSFLPHLCGAAAGLKMGLEQAARCGLLPADPGQPWEVKEKK